MMKKTDLFQVPGTGSYDKKASTGTGTVPGADRTSAQAANARSGDTHPTENAFTSVAPQISNTLKIEPQHSGTHPAQTSSYSKQLKINQIYSDQAGAALHGTPLPAATSPRVAQAILVAGQNASGSQWDRAENVAASSHHVSAAHQILQSRQHHQKPSLPNSQAAGVFTSRDPQFSKKSGGLHLFDKSGTSAVGVFANKESTTGNQQAEKTAPGQKSGHQASSDIANSAFQHMRSRSPHNSNFLMWGHQSATQKNQSSNTAGGSQLTSNVGLALKMHNISDSKRHQANLANPASSNRGGNFQGSVWGGNVLEANNSQQPQRAAGKASGLTYTQNEHGNFVDQSNRDLWKSTLDWHQGEEKVQQHAQHSNVFSQAGKQQQMNFNNPRLKAFAQSREGFINQVTGQAGSSARGQFNQFMGTPSQSKYLSQQQRSLHISKDESSSSAVNQTNTTSLNLQFGPNPSGSGDADTSANNINTIVGFKSSINSSTSGINLAGGSGADQSQQEQFKMSGGALSGKYRPSMDAQNPKPQLIQNQGGVGGGPKRITRGMNKGKPQVMHDSGLHVMGLPMKQPDQQIQTSAAVQHDLSMNEDLMEMTPDQNKDKYKKRLAVQSDAPSSIMKAPIHGKAQPSTVFMASQDQTVYEHKRHADDGVAHHHRRAESMGKQKLQGKFSGKADEMGGLEGFLQVKHLKQTHESLPLRGKKQRHHNSFQGAIRPIKNAAPFKAKQTNSTNSQLNDSGHGSGGNAAVTMTTSGLNSSHVNEPANSKFGLNMTTTLSSEHDSHLQLIQKSHLKNRRQVAPNNPVIALHPMIQQKGNQHLVVDKFYLQQPKQLSPATNHSMKMMTQSSQQSETQKLSGGGEQKMNQLYKEFKEAPPIQSQKNMHRTPISTRKKSKKSKLVLRGEVQVTKNLQSEVPSDSHTHLAKEETSLEELHPQKHKESAKHRKIKNMIRQNKVINNLNVSSFVSQERDGSQSPSDEDDLEREEMQQPDAQQLQQIQSHIHRSKGDSSSEDELSRDEGATGEAMAIIQGFTPSGLASSTTHKNQGTSSQLNSSLVQSSPEQQQFEDPKEFRIEEEDKDEVVMTQVKDRVSATESGPSIKDRLPLLIAKENTTNLEAGGVKEPQQKQMHPIFSKASLSKERLRESENFSKHQSSNDSSFQQKFQQLIRESESLKWQYQEILLNKLAPSDPAYSEFVDRLVTKNRERESQSFFKSMPARKDDLTENKFTLERVVYHIENQKKLQSEHIHRPFHSDMSRSRFLSNSVREDHPSITSPNFSGTAGVTGLRGMQLHFQRHERKRRLHRYLSFSNGVTYHAKSAQQASALLPELSGGRYRNSFCQFGGRPFGVSDSLSQRQVLLAVNNNNSSNSNQTVPTPIQQENKKLEDLKDATNRVQIVKTSQDGAAPLQGGNGPSGRAGAAAAPPSSSLQMIYERLNMNDKKVINRQFLPAMMQQQKQENNFFPQTEPAASAAAASTLPQAEPPSVLPGGLKRIFGKVIEWQIGKQLGNGTTGEVYEALNIDTGETFAVKMIKLMHPYLGLDQQKVKSVKKEIQRYKQLNHKHIVKYFDSEIIENNVLCIYLEYVYKSVAQMCKEYGKIGEKNVRMYTHQILRALVYLHSQSVTHGDLKGANVLVSQDGKEIKLCDMGNSLLLKAPQQPTDLSASSRSLLSVNSLVCSSPAWMAPETHMQKVGKRSDIWSLGCLVVEMLTGQSPWGTRLDGESSVHVALQRRLANKERPDIPADVSEECQNFIDRCLQHDAKVRPSASQLLDDPWIKSKEHGSIMSPPR